MHHLSPLLAFVAGVLTILSPCVLPLMPIVFAGAHSRHRFGPLALCAGLALSFTATGVFISTIGFSLGLDPGMFRTLGAVLLVAVGLALAVPRVQHRLEFALAPVGNWANGRVRNDSAGGVTGQFAMGGLLGLVWLPCVGPTLGAASVLAAEGKNLGEVSAVMLAFGLGAALPLGMIGALSTKALGRRRDTLIGIGSAGRRALGIATILIGGMILSGADHWLETGLTEVSPTWLVTLTARY